MHCALYIAHLFWILTQAVGKAVAIAAFTHTATASRGLRTTAVAAAIHCKQLIYREHGNPTEVPSARPLAKYLPVLELRRPGPVFQSEEQSHPAHFF